MSEPKPIAWRPPARIRPIAIGVVRRGEDLLLMAVRDDAGNLKGWRPLGGGIEFGERAADAVRRELAEELGLTIADPRLLGVVENLYEHEGANGHEIVFVFEVAFADPAAYARDRFSFRDAEADLCAEWVRWLDVPGDQLFPTALKDLL
jgi:ADP-ribose pyrophosphatase YjhB (NUDIX family)